MEVEVGRLQSCLGRGERGFMYLGVSCTVRPPACLVYEVGHSFRPFTPLETDLSNRTALTGEADSIKVVGVGALACW